MSSTFYIPALNLMGKGAVNQAVKNISDYGYQKALMVTDAFMNKSGMAATLQNLLREQHIDSVMFDGVQPNPTVDNVDAGLAMLQVHHCDCVVSLGGGSAHDCAKGIALLATNGGSIRDYEGVDVSHKPQLPLISFNTTAGTASEMTRFCIITDEARHVKMAIVDKNVTPIMSVNDPELMQGMPASLTAATGMDALTHAIEAYVSTAATPLTDAVALKAIELISQYLPQAVENGADMQAREQMAYAQFMAGMAFNNASLGYVHAMAHQLGGFYNLPHGVCNAVLLPYVTEFNASCVAERLQAVAEAMGLPMTGLSDMAISGSVVEAIKVLSVKVGIPTGLAAIGVQEADLPVLADNALKDACGLTNPRRASKDDIINIFRSAL